MLITTDFYFEAAHKLLNYNGPCKNLHGHSYRLGISVSGPIKKDGMVIDFVTLNKIVTDNIISKLDHTYLNDIIEQPTAENIVVWIWNKLSLIKFPIYEIKLWETANSHVTYRGKYQETSR